MPTISTAPSITPSPVSITSANLIHRPVSCNLLSLLCLVEQTPSVQSAGDRPSLGRGAARKVRRPCVENLTDGAHCPVLQRVAHRRKHSLRCLYVAGNSIDGEAERSEKPSPDWTLMIAAIAFQDATAVAGMVLGATWRQRAQPICRKKMASADPHDSRLIVQIEWTVRQAHGKDLVGPDASIVAVRTVNHIEQTLSVGPHESCKTSFYGIRQHAKTVRLC